MSVCIMKHFQTVLGSVDPKRGRICKDLIYFNLSCNDSPQPNFQAPYESLLTIIRQEICQNWLNSSKFKVAREAAAANGKNGKSLFFTFFLYFLVHFFFVQFFFFNSFGMANIIGVNLCIWMFGDPKNGNNAYHTVEVWLFWLKRWNGLASLHEAV